MQLESDDHFHRDPGVGERYQIESRIALGGFGAVYLARQRTTGQNVAIKTLRFEHADSQTEIARFRQETRLGALLHHPNIVRLLDSGEAQDGSVFAVFEYVRGNSLADALAAEAAFAPSETLHLMLQVLDALACAHEQDVIHRDLKPANIMLTESGARRNAMVMDFGLGTFVSGSQWPELGRLTGRDEYLGTPAYSAPEQLLLEPALAASDIYSWGLVFLECLTGRPAFDGPTPLIIHRQLSPEPVPIPKALEDHPVGELLAAVLAKGLERRPASAAEIFRALQAIREPLPTSDEISGSSAISKSDSRVRPRRGVELSRVWSVPVRRNSNFTGRDDLLERVHANLNAGETLVALRGLGGVGKTQLGIEFAYRFGDDYDVVAWVHAGDPDSLTQEFAALADALELPESDTPDQRRRIDAVRRWLERNGDWLVVFDNAPNPDAIRSFLPRTGSGHIVVTSRHPSWRDLGVSVEVEELETAEAADFLAQRTGDEDSAAAAELAECLGRLPLALEEAAAYIEATGRSIREYLALLRDQQEIVLERVESSGSESLRTTWEIAFRQVEAELPEAADLLQLCAFFGPDGIPFELIRQGAERIPESLARSVADPLGFDRCLAALRRYSLLKVDRGAITLHRMVQLATRARLDARARDDWAACALRVAEIGFPRSGLAGDYQPDAGRSLPHALATIEHARAIPSCHLEIGRLLNRTGTYLSARGFHTEACQHLEYAVALIGGLDEPQEGLAASVLADLSLVRFALGNLDTARAHVETALEIHERLRGPKHFRVALDLIGLTYVLQAQGELERARECAERSVGIVESVFDSDHPMLANALSLLGRAQWGLGEIDAARASTGRAIVILSNQPLYHPLLCASWCNLARVQIDVGEIDAAQPCAERALEIGLRAFGDNHQLVALARCAQGSIHDRCGRVDAALEAYEQALASAERSCTFLNEDIAIARVHIGDLLRRQGDESGARERLDHALHVMSRVAGDTSRLSCQVEAAFAALLLQRGEPGAAMEHADRALRAADARYGPDHPIRIPALNLLAHCERDLGAAAQAREIAERALAIAESALAGSHPDLAETHRLLSELGSEAVEVERHAALALALAPSHAFPAPLAPQRRR